MRLLVALALVSLTSLTSCVGELVADQISTEVSLSSAGQPGEVVEVRKRFRFSHDPRDARGVYFTRGRVAILSPSAADLRYLHRVEILVVDPATEEEVVVATAEDIAPGDRVVPLFIDFPDDLRPFASDDSRVTFVFRLQGNAWAPLPAEGLTFLASATIEIDL